MLFNVIYVTVKPINVEIFLLFLDLEELIEMQTSKKAESAN